MKPSTKRMLFILLAILFLLGAVFVYSSMIRPAYDEIALLRGELASKQGDLIRYQNTVERVMQLLSQFQDAAEVQRQVSLVLPNEPDVGYLTNQIVELSRINGIDLISLSTSLNPVRPASNKVVRDIGSMTAEMRLSGSYAGFKALVRQLENNVLLMDIGNIRVEGSDNIATLRELEYIMTLTSYYQAN